MDTAGHQPGVQCQLLCHVCKSPVHRGPQGVSLPVLSPELKTSAGPVPRAISTEPSSLPHAPHRKGAMEDLAAGSGGSPVRPVGG